MKFFAALPVVLIAGLANVVSGTIHVRLPHRCLRYGIKYLSSVEHAPLMVHTVMLLALIIYATRKLGVEVRQSALADAFG
jgi:hypothetical protein